MLPQSQLSPRGIPELLLRLNGDRSVNIPFLWLVRLLCFNDTWDNVARHEVRFAQPRETISSPELSWACCEYDCGINNNLSAMVRIIGRLREDAS